MTEQQKNKTALDTTKLYAVIGFGSTGQSCVRHLLSCGVVPEVFDTRENPPQVQMLPRSVTLHTGPLHAEELSRFDVLVLSPGIDRRILAISQAVKQGTEVVGDIELFARESQVPVIAITGSNGKSTVTTLVGAMAEAAGIKVAVGGNIGVPVLDLLGSDVELFVLELSSFQLETTNSLRPVAATVLNVTEDHLDRYASFDDYRQTKLSIYANAECCVVNRDDSLTDTTGLRSRVMFSAGEHADYEIHGDEPALYANGERVMGCSELTIVGRHNWANALAALALADAASIPRTGSLKALRKFSGLAHRSELVAIKSGIRWVNDSKATNIGATIAALQGLMNSGGQVWLIAGGDGKGADFALLTPWLTKTAGVVAFGRDADKIKASFPDTVLVDGMPSAVAWAKQQATAGDLVLLSPACASLDMYPNYMERGAHFRSLVEAL